MKVRIRGTEAVDVDGGDGGDGTPSFGLYCIGKFLSVFVVGFRSLLDGQDDSREGGHGYGDAQGRGVPPTDNKYRG